jgi:type VI secretion system secreted protein Hcp
MASTGIHLKLDGIKGESTDRQHKDEIVVESWHWGVANAGAPATGAGGGAGRASFTDLTFTHAVDRASTSLWRACATGLHIRDAVLATARRGRTNADFLVITMIDVLVTSVTMSQSADAPPMEQVSMRFARVDLEYRAQKPSGALEPGIHFKYDIAANREL